MGADLAGKEESEAIMDGPTPRREGASWLLLHAVPTTTRWYAFFRQHADALFSFRGWCQHDPDGPPPPKPKLVMGQQQTRAWKNMLAYSPYALKTVKFGNIDGEEGEAPNLPT